ncbi:MULTISPECIES: hypothetical protein [unclassified Streptomyces]|uniref:hypothetical protein n=1 Tax=unclassified Streptomyces TaxID=2593676 RepID=UPI002E1B5AD7|nr:hypothetical protein OG217_01190 [Streptomyces sp. NBC_01023]
MFRHHSQPLVTAPAETGVLALLYFVGLNRCPPVPTASRPHGSLPRAPSVSAPREQAHDPFGKETP